MKVLVTGANGFLGSWLTRRLCDFGHEVTVLRRPSSDISEIVGLPVRHALGDVTNKESVFEAARGMQVVFHLAGLVAYSKKMREPMEKINVEGTEHVVEACKSSGVKRLVHVSSVAAIGATFDGKKILDENTSFNVAHLGFGYFETKYKGEKIVKSAVDKGELDAVILNPATIYGRGDAKKGSRKMQVKVAKGQFPAYSTGGVNVVGVEDVVNGIMLAFEKGKAGERYILAAENLTIKKLFETIAEAAGVRPPSIFLPSPVLKIVGVAGDLLERFDKKGPLTSESALLATMFHWFNNQKSIQELGCTYSPSRDAIFKSVQWMKEKKLI